MRLSPHFSLAEFTASQTSDRLGLDNDLPAELLANARATCEMLERIRSYLTGKVGALHGTPIFITSGYRSPAVNRAVGSGPTSDHLKALAVDWHCPMVGRPTEVCKLLEPVVDQLGIGQLINEFPSTSGGWIHVSTRTPAKAVNRVITITKAGTFPGIREA
ncbi:MAG: D-Ala-D-Ala carboxypeptidase family metallohydrolase [bacterium]